MSTSPIIVSGEFAGRYTVERELGRGATSVVYLARDLDYGRMVAIKVLRDELSSGLAADRFLREIRLTAQLHHPNILPVLHSGEDTGRLYFVLPFMDGGTLRDRLDRDKQLPVAEVVAIGVTIANALASAHEKNVLHRDVKPENILFTGGQACLSDFGIARAITRSSEDSTTTQGFVRGTPAFMSPEQASGEHGYDGRSDLYSLACVLYEALAGMQPFVGPTPQAVIAQRLIHPARPVRVYRPSVSAELEAVLARALQVAPADRYQTAREFADALEAAAVSSTAELPGATGKVTGLRRRNAMIVGAVIVLLSALATWSVRSSPFPWFGSSPDTTRLMVVPFDSAERARGSFASGLILDGLQRWTGVSTVEDFSVAAAMRNTPKPVTEAAVRRLAMRFRAGRIVRGSLSPSGAVSLALFDSKRGTRLYGVRMTAPRDSSLLPLFFAELADSIVLRGKADSGTVVRGSEPRSAPAEQALAMGRLRLHEWDLASAESLFSRSSQFNPGSNRASLWLAQLVAWRARLPIDLESARSLAERAARDTLRLPRSERALAVALDQLVHGQYPAACDGYSAMIRADSNSFIGWYGLAQCTDFDRLVIPDPASRSGWRFRASKHLSVISYQRALELLPSMRAGAATGSFAQMRDRLATSVRHLRSGVSEEARPRRFSARAELVADTFAFFPTPLNESIPSRAATNWEAARSAVARARKDFNRIAASWIAAEPRAADAREAYALSLELLADPAAIAAYDSAFFLSTDERQRLRLAVASVFARLKYGLPGDTAALHVIRRKADSILTVRATTAADAEGLARLAALLGRCDAARRLTRESAEPIDVSIRVPQSIVADAQSLLVTTALGCRPVAGERGFDAIARDIAQLGGPPSDLKNAQIYVLGAALQASFPPDRRLIEAFVTPRNYLLRAERAWLDQNMPSARVMIDSLANARASAGVGDVTPDAVLPEARLRLALGDTVGARRVLDVALSTVLHYTPMTAHEGAGNILLISSLLRAAQLRGELGGTGSVSADWATAVRVLWSTADPDLRSSLSKSAGNR